MIAKSQTWRTEVYPSLTGEGETEPPEPYQSWVDEVIKAGAAAEAAAAAAAGSEQSSAEDAAAAEAANQHMQKNIFVTRQKKKDVKKNITLPPCRYLMMRGSVR